ncbi:hypothetical protein ABIB62_003924 [Mucilaginibacter sp. UYP25]|uniref:hypothetical protein n=1 Tax=unclassified Mucilaginibacter TaxID=2617802 RepID=UPI0033950C92
MQDKEIDSLFRSKLDNFEVEPSAAVWGGITSQIDKKKKPFGVYLSSAASLLILLGAGLYFVSNTKEITKKPVQIAVAKNNKPAKTIIQPVTVAPKLAGPQTDELRRSMASFKANGKLGRKQKTKFAKDRAVSTEEQAIKPAPQLAQVVQKVDVPVKFVVPDRSVTFNDKIDIPDNQPLKTNTLAAQAQDATASKTLAAAPVKKHRFRNFGDLINAVVGKVDKRKDKLIEFSTTKDEDDSTLSGLNLGFIKIKKIEE